MEKINSIINTLKTTIDDQNKEIERLHKDNLLFKGHLCQDEYIENLSSPITPERNLNKDCDESSY